MEPAIAIGLGTLVLGALAIGVSALGVGRMRKQGEPNAEPPVAPPVPPPPTSQSPDALHQLPPAPADFTGRQAELDELTLKLTGGGVAISGFVSSPKTSTPSRPRTPATY